MFRKEIHLYATAAAIGCVGFVMVRRIGWHETHAAWMGMALILALRLAAIRYKLSLPQFRQHDEPTT